LETHPWLDPEEAAKIDEKLRSVLKLNIKSKSSGNDEEKAESEEANSDDEGAKKKSNDDVFKESMFNNMSADADDKQITEALFELLDEKRTKEKNEDTADGDHEKLDKGDKLFGDGEIEELLELYKEELGLHLIDIEDEEEYIEKWFEWVQTKIKVKYGRQKKIAAYKT